MRGIQQLIVKIDPFIVEPGSWKALDTGDSKELGRFPNFEYSLVVDFKFLPKFNYIIRAFWSLVPMISVLAGVDAEASFDDQGVRMKFESYITASLHFENS